ncbi:MurR/RpiR family transcriptional regulator [Sphaerisporangium fuscum]|uniref:MurR/RpiR family transcriptional regulator n=1 Tax=Sphaerisporangium fuscum TaxID=2835868 RepID=UPI0020299655|nr:hypothetical protein [Sphaerisporangium fuscum]
MTAVTGAGASSSVAERIRSRMGQLSAGERKVARALLAHYPSAGLGSTHELAQRAGVSALTVVRFVAHLDFDGYKQFQQALRDEVQERRASPLMASATACTSTSPCATPRPASPCCSTPDGRGGCRSSADASPPAS